MGDYVSECVQVDLSNAKQKAESVPQGMTILHLALCTSCTNYIFIRDFYGH